MRSSSAAAAIAAGSPGSIVVGLRRGGFTAEQLRALKRAYDELFFGGDQFADRLAHVAESYAGDAHVMRIVEFIRSGKRKLAMPRDTDEQDD